MKGSKRKKVPGTMNHEENPRASLLSNMGRGQSFSRRGRCWRRLRELDLEEKANGETALCLSHL